MSLTLRLEKGNKLTPLEMDSNLTYLEQLGQQEEVKGTQYVYVKANGTDVENAQELQEAYTTAQGMNPKATNRITVIAAPGNYNFETNMLVMDTQFIDLVSLDGNRSVLFNHTLNTGNRTEGSISITANDVFVKGVNVLTKNFTIETNLNLLKVENCEGGNNSFGSGGITSGTFTNCQGGGSSFGGGFGEASGTFTNCQGGDFSFGGGFGTASGTFTNCQGGGSSFGGGFGEASGTFTNCQGGNSSFGSGGIASGTFTDCVGGGNSFQPLSGNLSYSKLLSNSLPNGNTLSLTGGIILGSIEFAGTGNDVFITKRP